MTVEVKDTAGRTTPRELDISDTSKDDCTLIFGLNEMKPLDLIGDLNWYYYNNIESYTALKKAKDSYTKDLSKLNSDENTVNERNKKVDDALKKRMEDEHISATLTVSEESKKKYAAMAELNPIKVMRGGCSNIGLGRVKEDAFDLETRNKWNVFDDYLSYCGFFDTMPKEDREELYKTMDKILIVDDITTKIENGKIVRSASWLWSAEPGTDVLYSYEAALELESSTAALKYFSDKSLTGEQKEGFDALIDKYYETTSLDMVGYMSGKEAMAMRASGNSRASGEIILNQSASDIKKTLGAVKHTPERKPHVKRRISKRSTASRQLYRDYK